MTAVRSRGVRAVAAVALSMLAAPALRAQTCVGAPAGVTLNLTALRNTDGGSRTWSAGGAATYAPRHLFAVVEVGSVKSSAQLLTKNGTVGSAGLGWESRRYGRVQPCVAVGASWGTAPAAAGTTGESLGGGFALAGAAVDLVKRGAQQALGYASFQLSNSNGATGSLLRAGVLYIPTHRFYARAGAEFGHADGASSQALSVSLGLRIR